MRHAALLALFYASAAFVYQPPRAADPASGEELVRMMHDKYAGKWYQTMTFVQKTTQANGTVETWYESLKVPGYLRIDIEPLDSGRAAIYRNDSLYQIQRGVVRSARPSVHPLLVLGFDVYGQPAETTIGKLKGLGFDLTKIHAGMWQGKKVWIVGAPAGDERTNQFWVDQENLLFVRMVQLSGRGAVSETQFNKYVKIGGGWISTEVLFFSNGQKGTSEEYTDVKIGMPFPDQVFDPKSAARPAWIKAGGSLDISGRVAAVRFAIANGMIVPRDSVGVVHEPFYGMLGAGAAKSPSKAELDADARAIVAMLGPGARDVAADKVLMCGKYYCQSSGHLAALRVTAPGDYSDDKRVVVDVFTMPRNSNEKLLQGGIVIVERRDSGWVGVKWSIGPSVVHPARVDGAGRGK